MRRQDRNAETALPPTKQKLLSSWFILIVSEKRKVANSNKSNRIPICSWVGGTKIADFAYLKGLATVVEQVPCSRSSVRIRWMPDC